MRWMWKDYCVGDGVSMRRGMASTGVMFADKQCTVEVTGVRCDLCDRPVISVACYDGTAFGISDIVGPGWTIRRVMHTYKEAKMQVMSDPGAKERNLVLFPGNVRMIGHTKAIVGVGDGFWLLEKD